MQRYSPGSKYKPILIKDMEIEKESEKKKLYEGPMNLGYDFKLPYISIGKSLFYKTCINKRVKINPLINPGTV